MHAENLLQAGKKSGDPKETTLNLTVPALKKKHGEECYHHLMAGILSLTQMAGMRVLTWRIITGITGYESQNILVF